jgi:chemotaxis methyl-accepting protein methylase
MHTVDASHHRIDELVRRTTGLCVREKELDGLVRWAGGRIRVLVLAGRCERELLTVRFSTGETYFFRDQGQFELLANRILPELIERRAAFAAHLEEEVGGLLRVHTRIP